MNPNEFTFSIKSPKRNNDPSLVNPKMVTKTALSHSKPLCTKGTFKISTANTNCMSSPFQTNCQSIPFLLREQAKAIPIKVAIPSSPLNNVIKLNPLLF